MVGYPPDRNAPITEAREIGRIVRDLQKETDIERIDSNFIYIEGGKTKPDTSPTTILSTSVFSLPSNQFTTALLMATNETDPIEHLVVQVVARLPNGIPFLLQVGPKTPIPGSVFFEWYIDAAGDLYINIWNGLEDLEAKVWFV